jgi:hypothetical protein
MSRHARALQWEKKLKQVLDGIDEALENRHGNRYRLHPARPRRGQTANREADGLFRVAGLYTPGFGSGVGKGYILRIEMATLEKVSPEERKAIENEAVELLRRRLPEAFPGRDMKVSCDGGVFKIHGDLSLGSA